MTLNIFMKRYGKLLILIAVLISYSNIMSSDYVLAADATMPSCVMSGQASVCAGIANYTATGFDAGGNLQSVQLWKSGGGQPAQQFGSGASPLTQTAILGNGPTYSLYCTASDTSGNACSSTQPGTCGQLSNITVNILPTPPSVAAFPTALAVPNGIQIIWTIGWGSNASVTGIKIARDTATNVIGTVGPNTSTFTDTTVVCNGAPHTYYIYPYNSCGPFVNAIINPGLPSTTGSCSSPTGTPPGQCQSDANCPTGQACVAGVCVPRTVTNPPAPTCRPNGQSCTTNGQCCTGAACSAGVCRKSCSTDANCATGEACVSGFCVARTVTNTPVPTATPTCLCGSNGVCSTACPFNKLASGTYSTPVKCTLSSSIFSGTPNSTDKNNWCRRPTRTEGDADGRDGISSTDYYYYVQIVSGGKVPTYVSADFSGDGEVGRFDRDIVISKLGI